MCLVGPVTMVLMDSCIKANRDSQTHVLWFIGLHYGMISVFSKMRGLMYKIKKKQKHHSYHQRVPRSWPSISVLKGLPPLQEIRNKFAPLKLIIFLARAN